MKLNYDLVLSAPDGEPYKDDKGNNLTLKQAIVTACSFALPGDDSLSMVEKFSIGECAMLAYKGLDLTTEQVAKVKERSAKGFQSPLLIYILHTALESVQ